MSLEREVDLEERKVEITVEGAHRVADLYSSLPKEEAETLKQKLQRALDEILEMSPEEIFEEAFRLANEETEQIYPES